MSSPVKAAPAGGDSETPVLPSTTKAEEKKDSSGIKHLLRVFTYNDRQGWLMNAVAFLCMIASGSILPLMDVVFGQFVNVFNGFVIGTLSPSGFRDGVNKYSLYFVYLFVAKFALTYVWTILISITGIRTTSKLRVHFVRQILRQEVSFFDAPSSSVAGQIATNGNLVSTGISEKLGLTIQALSSFITAFIVAFAVQWKLTLIVVAIVPFNLAVNIVCIYFDTICEYALFDIYSRSGSLADEAFSSVRTAHAFWAFPKLSPRFDAILDEAARVGAKKSLIYAILFPSEFFSVFAGYGLAFWQGIRMYADGEIEHPGTVVTVIFAILVAAQALTQIAPQSIAISKASAAAQQLFATIDRESEIDSLSPAGTKIPDLQGNISLRNVRFAYPSRPDMAVLHGLNLEVPANKTTALVGASGSGKSTIFGLLERWYLPQRGSTITLDGHPIEDLNLAWLRTRIRLVQQEPTLFSGTIFQNVEDGLAGTDMADLPDEEKRALVRQACEAAYAHDFIQELPSGYETWIGERGASLSGGQKQRIVIARTIISNPAVLLLDEATSALDPNAEKIVQRALNNVSKGRTMVVIAHRLSTVRDADNIVVMSRGETVEQGTHLQLVELGGAYAKLVAAQDLGHGSGAAADADEAEGDQVPDHNLDAVVTQASEPSSPAAARVDREKMYSLVRGLYMIIKEQRPLWPHFSVLAVCCIVAGATYPALAVLFSETMGAFQTVDVSRGNFFSLMFFVVALGNLVSYAISGWLCNIVAQHVMRVYRSEVFSNTLRQDMTFFDQPEHSSGALVSRLSAEPTSLQELLSMNIFLIVINMVNLLSSSVLAIAVGWKLGLVLVLGALPLLVGAGYLRIRLEFRFDDDTAGRFAESSGLASEAVLAIRTVSSLALENTVVERYRVSLHGLTQQAVGGLGWKMLFYSLSQSMSFLAMALGFWYGGRLLSTGEYSTGQFYIVFVAVIFCGESAAMFFQYTTSITKARTAINYVFRLRRGVVLLDDDGDDGIGDCDIGDSSDAPSDGDLEGIRMEKNSDDPAETASGILTETKDGTPSETESGIMADTKTAAPGTAVDVDGVGFAYPLRPGIPVLRGIDIDIPSGAMVALVGASGCGKSTVVALLERFYDPSTGFIRTDGRDIAARSRRRHRRHVALVQQEPVLYQGSIRDNVALGVEDREPEEEAVIEACRQANAWDFVSSLPQGLDTPCGSQGLALSGGQRQRIAIARALVRRPRLLLLDEATSALDTASERVVKEALDRAAAGRTTVAVAHRLSTIRDADAIVVLVRGRVEQVGTHQELIARRGLYYQMVLGQSLDREAVR